MSRAEFRTCSEMNSCIQILSVQFPMNTGIFCCWAEQTGKPEPYLSVGSFMEIVPSMGIVMQSFSKIGSLSMVALRYTLSSLGNSTIPDQVSIRVFMLSSTDLAMRQASMLASSFLKKDLKLLNTISTALDKSVVPSVLTLQSYIEISISLKSIYRTPSGLDLGSSLILIVASLIIAVALPESDSQAGIELMTYIIQNSRAIPFTVMSIVQVSWLRVR